MISEAFRLESTTRCVIGVASCVLAVACGARSDPPSTPPSRSSLDRFVDTLKDGQTLYGLGVGCDEWRAKPGGSDIQLELDDDDEDQGPRRDPPPPGAEPLAGSLTARADGEGRIYSFTYSVDLAKTPVRMRITGRGGWQPAPGVTLRSANDPSNAIIGVGNYCVTEVDVRADPHVQDALFVGDEAWYLTRDACLRSKRSAEHRPENRRGCSATKAAKPPGARDTNR